jgi:hypothetical protein
VGNQKEVGLSAIFIRFGIAAVVCDDDNDDDCGGNARQLARAMALILMIPKGSII